MSSQRVRHQRFVGGSQAAWPSRRRRRSGFRPTGSAKRLAVGVKVCRSPATLPQCGHSREIVGEPTSLAKGLAVRVRSLSLKAATKSGFSRGNVTFGWDLIVRQFLWLPFLLRYSLESVPFGWPYQRIVTSLGPQS